jgi:hypothetical protein
MYDSVMTNHAFRVRIGIRPACFLRGLKTMLDRDNPVRRSRASFVRSTLQSWAFVMLTEARKQWDRRLYPADLLKLYLWLHQPGQVVPAAGAGIVPRGPIAMATLQWRASSIRSKPNSSITSIMQHVIT